MPPKLPPLRAVNFFNVAVCGRNIVVIVKQDIAVAVHDFAVYFFLPAIGPKPPFTIGANRHIALELVDAVFSVSSVLQTLFYTL